MTSWHDTRTVRAARKRPKPVVDAVALEDPVFLTTGGRDVLVAVVSLKADQACVANGFNYRLDTPSARAFLGQFVTLP